MAEDCIEHQRGHDGGREGAWAVATNLHRWMSDFTLTVEDIAVAGDTVWTRNRAKGTNTGPFMGNRPSGKPVELDVIDILRFENGIAVEHWGIADQLAMMIQTGALPPRPQPAAPGAAL
jgi:predicted ester cyclase